MSFETLAELVGEHLRELDSSLDSLPFLYQLQSQDQD
jgi:hypothetical protein